LAALTHVDHQHAESFIAIDLPGDRVIASAMLAADAQMKTAEVAISIDSEYKNRGIGWVLLEHIARYARAHGVKTLQSIESRENHAAIELEREMGFTARPFPDDSTLMIVESAL
jgi:acetyltransferase